MILDQSNALNAPSASSSTSLNVDSASFSSLAVSTTNKPTYVFQSLYR